MRWLLIVIPLLIAIFIIRSRKRSIVGMKSQQKHFINLAHSLNLEFRSDQYFVQLQGKWNASNVIILPHQFEGPGSLTLIYLETRIPAVDRNWIEPNVSLGRALVEKDYGYEVCGTALPSEKVLAVLKEIRYPYIAVTLPTRFVYSPLLHETGWKNFVVMIALNEGRKPSVDRLRQALDSAKRIATAL
jgi:hypothetical protein